MKTWHKVVVTISPLLAGIAAFSSGQRNNSNQEVKTAVTQTTATAELSSQFPWHYSGRLGPEYWGQLAEGFSTCSNGLEQSPVDIPTKTPTQQAAQFIFNANTARILDTGLQLKLDLGEKSINNQKNFQAHEIIFHTPSEHTISGLMYPMEVEIIYSDQSKRIRHLGVFIETGSPDPVFDKILQTIKDKKIADLNYLDPNLFLPTEQSYWQYQGSLTAPPCTEGITWQVFKKPIQFSVQQIKQFRSLFPINARPTQALNQRSFVY